MHSQNLDAVSIASSVMPLDPVHVTQPALNMAALRVSTVTGKEFSAGTCIH